MGLRQTLLVVVVLLHPFLLSLLAIPVHNALKFDPRLRGSIAGDTATSASSSAFRFGLVVLVYTTAGEPMSFAVTRLSTVALVIGFLLYQLEYLARQRYSHSMPVIGARIGAKDVWVVPAAVMEEILYRGALAPLVDGIGPLGYLVVSSVGFGASHLKRPRVEIPYKTALGAVFGLCYLATGTLAVPILAHFGYNLAYLESQSEHSIPLSVS